MQTVGQIIREKRKEKGLTLEQLSEKIGADYSTISHWERDERVPRLFTACDLADVFGCTVDDLCGRKRSDGEWIDLYKGKYAKPLYACSVCEKGTLLRVEVNELGQSEIIQALSPYCPNCGSRMKGCE